MATATKQDPQHSFTEYRDEFDAVLSQELSQYGAAMFRYDSGLYRFVHPSSKGYRWQITVYDDSGIVSDTQHSSIEDMYPIIQNGVLLPNEIIEDKLRFFANAELSNNPQLISLTCETHSI